MMGRVARWSLAISVALAGSTVIYVALRNALGWPRGGIVRWVPVVMGAAPLVVVFPVAYLRLRWIRRAWRSSGGRVCTRCAYEVNGLPPTGVCPECGGGYDVKGDAGAWAAGGLRRD